MRRRVVPLVTLVALFAALAVPSFARAAGSVDVALVGTFTDPGGVTGGVGGVLTVEGFADHGGLVALGTATYSLCIPGVDPKNCLATITQAVEVPVADVAATCTAVTVDLAAFRVVSPPSLDGFTLDFDAIELGLSPATASGERAACALARQLDHGARDANLARSLSRLLAAG